MSKTPDSAELARQQRLSAALRANLAKRKARDRQAPPSGRDDEADPRG
jgi:hypothetical protein